MTRDEYDWVLFNIEPFVSGRIASSSRWMRTRLFFKYNIYNFVLRFAWKIMRCPPIYAIFESKGFKI